MDHDKIEIISEELSALKDLWNLLRASSSKHIEKEACEELLLNIFEIKLIELSKIIKR